MIEMKDGPNRWTSAANSSDLAPAWLEANEKGGPGGGALCAVFGRYCWPRRWRIVVTSARAPLRSSRDVSMFCAALLSTTALPG